MPELHFQVEGVEPQRQAAVPLLHFRLRLTETTATPIHSILLRTQVQIQPARRRYTPAEQQQLVDLFGTPERWGQTVRTMPWTQLSLAVPAFSGQTLIDLPVPCSHDFTLAATHYFDALNEGEIPLCFLFSGTVFYESAARGVQVALIPWEKESTFRLPAALWHQLMELHHPNRAWLCLRKDVFDRLVQFKSRRGLPSWEQALEELLVEKEAALP